MDDRASEQPRDEQRADPARAQYVINLTPEQYESHLKRATAKEAAPPRQQVELGGSGVARVHFHNAAGDETEVTSVEWSATGPVTVTPDEADMMSAKLVSTGLGPVTITATGNSVAGSTQAHVEVMVIANADAPVDGEIEITVEPPPPEMREARKAGGGFSAQGSQILPVPPPAPPHDRAQTVPPAQTMAQPSPQPQPQSQSESESQSESRPESRPD